MEPLANKMNRDIIILVGLRERTIGEIGDELFNIAKRKVYEDFCFRYLGGESSDEAQERAITDLKYILQTYDGKKIVIGTHRDIMTLFVICLNHIIQESNHTYEMIEAFVKGYALEVKHSQSEVTY